MIDAPQLGELLQRIAGTWPLAVALAFLAGYPMLTRRHVDRVVPPGTHDVRVLALTGPAWVGWRQPLAVVGAGRAPRVPVGGVDAGGGGLAPPSRPLGLPEATLAAVVHIGTGEAPTPAFPVTGLQAVLGDIVPAGAVVTAPPAALPTAVRCGHDGGPDRGGRPVGRTRTTRRRRRPRRRTRTARTARPRYPRPRRRGGRRPRRPARRPRRPAAGRLVGGRGPPARHPAGPRRGTSTAARFPECSPASGRCPSGTP